jgi:hypothetical protein
MGVVLIILGFIDYLGLEISKLQESPWRSKLTIALLLLGGYGFLSMFYWAGRIPFRGDTPFIPTRWRRGHSTRA